MNSMYPTDNKLVRNIAMKNDKKDDFFHSTSYGSAQNEGNIGTASTGLTMAEREAIDAKRKFVQKYNESSLVGETFSLRHAKAYNPDAEVAAPAPIKHNRTNVEGDANGNVRTGFGRISDNDNNVIGIGGRGAKKPGERSGYTPFKSGSAPSAPARPSATAGFSPNIKPSFK